MAAVKVGVDIIEIERIERALERPGFRERCFTEAEREYCDSRPRPAQSYAGRFAGKEAVGKALGFGVARQFAWREIEIVGRPKPSVTLSGRLARWAEARGAGRIDVFHGHIAAPVRRRAFRVGRNLHQPGNRVIADLQRRVRAARHFHGLGTPAEQLGVELACALGIGGHELAPAERAVRLEYVHFSSGRVVQPGGRRTRFVARSTPAR